MTIEIQDHRTVNISLVGNLAPLEAFEWEGNIYIIDYQGSNRSFAFKLASSRTTTQVSNFDKLTQVKPVSLFITVQDK